MTQAKYKKIQGRTILKKSPAGKQFAISVYYATRTTNNIEQSGLLFEHQQKLKNGNSKKLGANFFVKERDLAGFLLVLKNCIIQNQDKFSSQASKKVTELIAPSVEIGIHNLVAEIESLKGQLDNLNIDQDLEINQLQSVIARKDEQISAIIQELEKIRQMRQHIRVVEMERQVNIFKQTLTEFKLLVENGKEIAIEKGVQQESLFQNFLKKNFWMFGIQYINITAKPKSEVNRIPDLLLHRTDGFSDVVELENPTDQIFVNVTKRPEQSGALKEALAQTMDYVDDYTLRYRDEYYNHHIDTYKPNGIIVIGRKGEQELERRRRQLNAYLHGIQIWTYDDLISNAEQVISLLEKGPIA